MDAYLALAIPGTILMWFFVRCAVDEMNPLLFLIVLLPAIIASPLLLFPTNKELRQMEEKRKKKEGGE